MIIERDSKATTYKFALLRAVIDIVQDNTPFINFRDNRVHFPTGLLIEKWLLYYYPILASPILIPQINGDTRLAFEQDFLKVIQHYETVGGFSVFYNDLKNKGVPPEIRDDMAALIKKLKQTITRMPMKYIGRSLSNEFYSIFQFTDHKQASRHGTYDLDAIIQSAGSFSIPMDYYEAFSLLGAFINGQDSILFKWAEFSVRASASALSVDKVVNEILKSPVTERDILDSKKLYRDALLQAGQIHCVWTGAPIRQFDVDHVIPFSVWKNNELWNLLPSRPAVNNGKRDKIPAPALIEKQEPLILQYWDIIQTRHPERFHKELRRSLTGNRPTNNWQHHAIEQLKNSCAYLINKRGFEAWTI